jgi:hypothetical protein
VADHITPWSQGGVGDARKLVSSDAARTRSFRAASTGGPTTPDNLANACAGCSYSRADTSFDVARVAIQG